MARHSRTDRPGSGSDSCKTTPTRSRHVAPAALNQAAEADPGHGPGGGGGRPVYGVFRADAVHLAPLGCRSGAAGRGEIEAVLRLFQVAGRKSEPRRDRATASVSPAQSKPTVSTTMSGTLP